MRAQVVLIQLDQVEFMQVFLPFAYDYQAQLSYYDKVKASGYNLLT